MPDLFQHVTIQPAYGMDQCVVRWTLNADYTGHGVLLYRSLDGLTDWSLVNPQDEPLFGVEFLDGDIGPFSMLDNLHYRLDAEDPETHEILEGPTVAAAPLLFGQDGRTAAQMINQELVRLRKGAGVPAYLIAPLRSGAPAGNTSLSGVTTVVPCPAADTAYGSLFAGGFERPYQTWVQLITTQQKQQDRPDGTGTVESVVVQARLPAFPSPRRGYLVVLPSLDQRYVVDGDIQPFLYRSLIPIAYQVTLKRLRPDDARYRLPVPMLDLSLTTPAYLY